MLQPAILYEDELNKKLACVAFNDRYKYYHMGYANLKITLAEDTWSRLQFVSMNEDNKIIGYISATISRPGDFIDSVSCLNFTDNKTIFGKDLYGFIDKLLKTFFKIKFCCVVGNPIISTYDSLVKKYNGRIVGTFEKDVKLMNNRFYDVRHYEIFSKSVGECNDS